MPDYKLNDFNDLNENSGPLGAAAEDPFCPQPADFAALARVSRAQRSVST
jgi:hypothetical protein